MSSRAPVSSSSSVSGAHGFSRFTWLVFAFTVAVILWGAYVRATGSGAGCGSHWPLCNGEVIPRSPGIETLIEYTHRLTSGLAFLLVVWLAVLAVKRFPRGHPVRKGAFAALFFMVTEALLGAGLVLFGLVGDNDTPARAWVMAFHLVNTLLLLAALALTAWWAAGRPAPRFADRPGRALASAVILLMLLVVGMSGAVAALGDTLFPAVSLVEGLAQDFDPESHVLVRLRVYHPGLALFSVLVVFAGVQRLLRRPSPETRRLGMFLVAGMVIQVLLGLVNLWLLAPVWLQLVHLLGADILWTLAVLTCASSLAEP